MRSIRLDTLKYANHAYSVFAFVTPPVWWAHIPIALNCFAAAAPQGLVFCSKAFASGSTYTLYFGTFIIVGNETAPVSVFDLEEALVTPYTMQARRGHKGCKKVGQDCESRRVQRRKGIKVGQCVGVQGLRRNGSDEMMERTGVGNERIRVGNERIRDGSERPGVSVGRRGRVRRARRRQGWYQPARKKTKHAMY